MYAEEPRAYDAPKSAVDKRPAVPDVVDELGRAIEVLEKHSHVLIDKIAGVLGPDMRVNAPGKPDRDQQPARSQLAAALWENVHTIQALTERVSAVIDRVEV